MEPVTKNLPVIAMRGLNVFPRMNTSFDLERPISVHALERAMENGEEIFLVTQREIGVEQPEEKDLYEIGTVARVTQILRVTDHVLRVMMEGACRARLKRLWQREPFLQAQVELIDEPATSRHSKRTEAMLRQTYASVTEYAELAQKLPDDVYAAILSTNDPGYLADFIAQQLNLRYQDKQDILDELRPLPRLQRMNEILRREIEVTAMEQDIESKVRSRVGKIQKDFVLREQIKVLQNEIGEGGEDEELDEYREKISKAHLSEEVERKLLKDVDKLAKQPFGSAEASVLRNYLDTCMEMPWGEETKERASVDAARKILDRDHYGLKKVKDRILEVLAVRKLAPDVKGQIICLVGPPGVGKTSIARSIAESLGRKYVRISLGGVRDEAEIRGHRRTYIGAMPGKIISAMITAKSSNPLMLLDEIDKLAGDYRGDPSSALLEVLDPEQNHTFSDHYLNVPFDLSKVMFITTANSTDTIPRPLLDRMEVIEVPSYLENEKREIAKRHLLPRQMEKHGLKKSMLTISDDVMAELIRGYTREAGVRSLERKLEKVCRKAACEIGEGKTRVRLTAQRMKEYLGPVRYLDVAAHKEDLAGVVNGLAWTSVGGELLEVEAQAVPGSGQIILTGKLGDVMQESARAALTFLKAHAEVLGIPMPLDKRDIHVHVPEGAVPKDGPSAGITIMTAIASALTGIPARADVAMTGEITLRGRVLPIGGLREKLLAAARAGMTKVIIPEENRKDLFEIPAEVRDTLDIVFARDAMRVLAEALTRMPGSEVAQTEVLPLHVPSHGRPGAIQ